MLLSRGRNPSAAEVLTQLVRNPELRGRVLTTLGLLLLVRLGIYIPMPGIDREAFQAFLHEDDADNGHQENQDQDDDANNIVAVAGLGFLNR